MEITALLYLVLWTVSPPLQIDTIYRLAAVGCLGLIALIKLKDLHSLAGKQIAAIFFLFMIVVVTIIQSGISSILRPISFYLLIAVYFLYYNNREEWYDYRILIPVVLVVLTVWNIRTVTALAENPAVARLIVRNDEAIYTYMRSGIGGYGLIYPQICICPAVTAWLFEARKQHKLDFLIGLVWLGSLIVYTLDSGYSIAAAALAIGIFLLIFYKRRNAVPALIIAIILIVAVVLCIGYSDLIRGWLLRLFDGTKVAVKINDIYTSFITEDEADSIAARMTRYNTSLHSIFLKYPLIGGLWRGGAGEHSAILDAFAQYGIFGGIVYVMMLFKAPMSFRSETNDPMIMAACNATFVSIFIVLMLDSAPYQFMMMLAVILPIIFSTLKEWRKSR